MDKSAFQLLKNTDRTNTNTWLHNVPIVDFGRVIKVIDIQTVIVEAIVRTSLSKEVYTVTLLNFSSNLLEIAAEPKFGDAVLLLFLRKHHPLMFMRETIEDPDAAGYNKFSGVGMLLSTAKKAAHTIISCYDDDGKPVTDMVSDAEIYGTFHNVMTIEFCRAVFDSEDEKAINIVFGAGRPLVEKHLARIEREHGFWKDPDNELVEMDASVTERYSKYAPLSKDIQGAQTTIVGLGTDKDDKPVETDAPITETVHGKAPVTRDIRAPQTTVIGIGNDEAEEAAQEREAPITETVHGKSPINRDIRAPQTTIVGIGNAESGDEAEERDAPVHETYGSKSPITKDIRGPQAYTIGIGTDGDTEAPVSIEMGSNADAALTSKSGLTAKFKKAFDLLVEDVMKLVSHKAVTLKSDSSELLEIGNMIATLGELGDTLLETIIAMKTVGSPGQHVVSPDDIAKFTQLKIKWGQVFKK
jgi:hypothetical protein